MAPTGLFFTSSSSPVVVLPPPSRPQPFSSTSDSHFASRHLFSKPSSSFHSRPWLGKRGDNLGAGTGTFSNPVVRQRDPTQSTAIDCNPRGRKRCRDEDSDGTDDMITPSTFQPGPVNSVGMTMMMGQSTNSSSHQVGFQSTVNWAEGSGRANKCSTTTTAASIINNASNANTNRPFSARRKFQRLHTSPPILTNPSSSSSSSSAPGKSHHSPDPPIDNFTLRLGIGWTNLNQQADKQAALRGWARYIEKNFPGLTNARILLQSKSLNDAFLVSTDQGFFLFDEEMSRARLVGRTEERTLMNLTATGVVPRSMMMGMGVVFDGEELVRGGTTTGGGTAAAAVGVVVVPGISDDNNVITRKSEMIMQGQGEAVQDVDISSSLSMATTAVVVMDHDGDVSENKNGDGDGDVSSMMMMSTMTSSSSSSITTSATAVGGALMDLD